jgi:hypothetical protein
MPRSFRAETADIQPRTVGPQFVEEQHCHRLLLLVVPCDSLTGTDRVARFRFGSEGGACAVGGRLCLRHVAAAWAGGRWLVWLVKERGVALEGCGDAFLVADGVGVL